MNEEYITRDNSDDKAREWLGLLGNHPSRRKRFKFDIDEAALLVLDMQGFFLSEKSHAYVASSHAISSNIQRLVGLFRGAGRPVIFTRHSLGMNEDAGIMGRWWKDTVREGTPQSAITSLLVSKESDILLRKTRYSAFIGTGLEEILREKSAQAVVITGVTTHLCCDSTARDAFMKDFHVFFVVDATATWSEHLHISSLKTLADGFVIPVATRDLLNRRRE